MMAYTFEEIARAIDHAILSPTATDADVEKACLMAREFGVAAVIVKPCCLPLAVSLLKGSRVAPGTTVGFPHGGNATAVKLREAEIALDEGANELDMICNIGKALSEQWGYVAEDIRAVFDLVRERGKILKVIFENCYLAEKHKRELCRICSELGVDFAKTSTGMGTGGATESDVKLMRELLPPRVRIKAAGGIRTLDQLLRFRFLGADRVGTSNTRVILEECRTRIQARR
jgi:deoxyribose-phosphate aldolase